MTDSLRADARRNRTLILEVARAEVAARGADASSEKIARDAGVGSATVRRHFPTRHALMHAVFRQRIDELCSLAASLIEHQDARAALANFLDEVLRYCVEARGFAITLTLDTRDSTGAAVESCSGELEKAAAPLVSWAIDSGHVSSRVTPADLLALVVGIALTTEKHQSPLERAGHLLTVASEGVFCNPSAMSTNGGETEAAQA